MLPDDPQAIVSSTYNPPISSSQEWESGRIDEYWTYWSAEERLIEATACWRRAPDRERGWLHVASSWPEIVRERFLGDYDARGYMGTTEDVPLKPMPLARAEVERMIEASEWLARYVDERDRQLVTIALGYKASGRRPPWTKIKAQLGIPFGPAGLARRYERAIGAVAAGLAKSGCPVILARI